MPEQFWNCAEITILPKTSNNQHSKHNGSIGDKKDKKDKDQKGNSDSMLPQEIIDHESTHAQYGQNDKSEDKKDKKKNKEKTDEKLTEITIHHENTHMSESQIFTEHQNESKESFRENEQKDGETYVLVNAVYSATVNRKTRNKNIRSRQVIDISGVPRVLSFITFDLSGEIDKVKLLTSATLKIFTLTKLTNSTRVTVRPVMGSFNASTITWDLSSGELGPRNTESKGAMNVNSNTWISIDITNAVEWSIGKIASSAVTLRLSTKNSHTLSFASLYYSGGSYSPQLVLEPRES